MLYTAATLLGALALASAHADIETLHGGGTSNPSKLFWEAMDLITARSRLPLHMTYRAIGSGAGQVEFVGSENEPPYTAWNDFGAGDIPMKASNYQALVDNNRQMIHVPFALGGIGVFHSVPAENLGDSGELDLTGCLLARIMSREITTWDHPDIVAINPGMTYTGDIKVVHRKKSSSSTSGFTSYLTRACPDHWDLGAGSTIVWPAGTFVAEGSGGMSDFIKEEAGAIGYIDAGHGHAENLGEVALQNRDGHYLTTLTAHIGDAGTVALEASPSVIPADPSADFSAVSLLDLEGPMTWPITLISYFYIEKDLTRLDPVTAGLLMYFVNFILSEEGQDLAESKKFVRLPATLIAYNQASLATLTLPLDTPTFTTEVSTQEQAGARPYVISKKRRSHTEVITDANKEAIEVLEDEEPERAEPDVNQPKGVVQAVRSLGKYEVAALAIGITGVVLSVLSFIMALVLCCSQKRDTKPRSVEIPARDLSTPSATVTKDAV